MENTKYVYKRKRENDIKDILEDDIIDSIGLPSIEYHGPEYNIRAVDAYCREKGIDTSQLTDEELKQFEV